MKQWNPLKIEKNEYRPYP